MCAYDIMEKGDKKKDSIAKKKVVVKKDKKVIRTKGKAQAQAKQTQAQEQKQSVKIVIGEKAKTKRKYVRKAKVMKPAANIVRGQTVVSYLGGEGDLNQVGSGVKAQAQPQAQPKGGSPPPQPPVLSSVQAPATLDSQLTAVSELSMPKARTPAFSEIQEEAPKKKTKAKAKSTLMKIGEGIGDFIKKNLLDQPLDIHSQEPSSAVEKPRPPIVIKPESKPLKPGKAKAEEIYMEVGEKQIVPSKTRKPIKGKTDVPVSISASKEVEREAMGMEDINVSADQVMPKKQEAPITKEERNESLRRMIVGDTVDDIISTIETPIFSKNPDFRTISQNVEEENVPASELDFGNEGLTQFNIEGFVPVGRQEGMVEVIEKKKGGRPKKYEDPELAKQMKAEQTRESNKRRAEAKKSERERMEAEDKTASAERLNQEWEDFIAVEEETDKLRNYIERKREEKRQEEESPYTFERQFPNSLQIQVAQDFNPLGEYAGSVLIKDVAQKIVNKRNAEAYDGDFMSGDFQQQIGDLFGSNNFSMLKPLNGEADIGYADESPVLTTATFSKDAIDSNLPFLGINDIEFL